MVVACGNFCVATFVAALCQKFLAEVYFSFNAKKLILFVTHIIYIHSLFQLFYILFQILFFLSKTVIHSCIYYREQV